MAVSAWKKHGKPAIDLLEEAMHLLRRLPLSTWVVYYVGTVPFVLGLLYFWSDMSRGAFAREHVAGYSFLLTLLYVWMKCWQGAACQRMEADLAGETAPALTAGGLLRHAAVQSVLQPIALIALPLAALVTLPFGWVRAYFQNGVALSRGDGTPVREISRAARELARLWPRQNHLAISIALLFGFFVWVNLALALLAAPFALRMLLGVETALSRGAWTLLNTTFFACVCGAAYLALDPLTKAFYVLRCFYGNALQSGRDLHVELRRLRQAMMILAGCLLLAPAVAGAAEDVAPLEADRLEESIRSTLDRPEFSWRLPREVSREEKGLIASFVEDLLKSVTRLFEPVKEWLADLVKWLEKWMRGRPPGPEMDVSGPSAWAGAAEKIVLVLGGVAVLLASLLLWKRWRQERRQTVSAIAIAAARPDLTAEDTIASQLPEDEWLLLADEMIARGEFRLAFRALYLAGLAHLGSRGLLTIARHKSNREYEREFRRRARPAREKQSALHANVAAFERVWYGRHAARAEDLPVFTANLEELRQL